MKNLSNCIRHILPTLIVGVTCLSASPARAASYDISMTADGFDPSYLEVTVGDRVYWWNLDYDYGDPHSTHSYSYPWNSGAVPVDYGVYLDTDKTGSFDYVDDVGYSGFGTLVINPAGPPLPPFISVSNRVDMVYDPSRDILYITSGNAVLRYQLGSESFLTPYQLSGSLMGIDLSPDGTTLVVADSSNDSTNLWVHVINLTTDETKRVSFPITAMETGTFAVAFGEDGAAVISSRGGSGPLHRYDPARGTVTTIGSGFRADSMVSSSGDGSTIIVAQQGDSVGAMDLYDVATRSIVRSGSTTHYNYESGASRDGALFALPTYYGTLIYNRSFTQVTNIGVYAGAQPIGAAFHPAADAAFFPFATTSNVVAYSTTTWEVLAEYNFQDTFPTPGNHAFGNGRIRISPDGQIIFVTVNGGLRYLRHGLSLPLTHRLVVAGNPAPYGEPTPISYGTQWLSDGTYLTLNVPAYVETNGTAYIAAGWTGTGSAAGSGTSTETSFSLNANTKVTWNWILFAVSANVIAVGDENQIVLQWPSVDGKSYDVLFASSPTAAYSPVASDLGATPPTNTYQGTLGSGRAGFFKVQMK